MAVRACAALTLGAACSTRVEAHAFEAGADTYARFVEGAAVPSSVPAVVLCLVPLGLLLGSWRVDGLPAVWPALLLGLGVGIACAPLVAPWVSLLALMSGVLCAAVAAFAMLPRTRTLMAMATLIVGLLAAATSLEGHARGEVPVATLAGLFLGANVTVAVPAAMASASIERWPRPWTRIGWRIAASWLGAIAVMYLAFELRPAGGA